MAINPEQDDDKQRKKSRFKKIRKIALPALASFGLLTGGSYFNSEFNNASDKLIALSQEYEQTRNEDLSDEMDKYAERIVSKESIASIYRLAAETDNIVLMYQMLNARDSNYDETWQTWLGKSELVRSTYYELADELVLTAYENGNEEYLKRYLRSSSVSDEVRTQIFTGIVEAENFELGLYFLMDIHDGHLEIGKFFDNEEGLTDAQHEFIEYVFYQRTSYYGNYLLAQYLKDGDLERAQNLITQASSPEDLHSTYLDNVARNGNIEEMIKASIFFGFSSDEDLLKFAVTAAKEGHYEAAEQFIERFDLDINDYFYDLWTYAAQNRNEEAAIYFLNKFHDQNGDEAILRIFSKTDGEPQSRFAFNIAKEIGAKLLPESQDILASYFSGTMDDHLRLYWEQESEDVAPETTRQIAPAPRP